MSSLSCPDRREQVVKRFSGQILFSIFRARDEREGPRVSSRLLLYQHHQHSGGEIICREPLAPALHLIFDHPFWNRSNTDLKLGNLQEDLVTYILMLVAIGITLILSILQLLIAVSLETKAISQKLGLADTERSIHTLLANPTSCTCQFSIRKS